VRVCLAVILACLVVAGAAGAESLRPRTASATAAGAVPARVAPAAVAESERIQVGAARHWTPARFQERVSLGLGWSIPQRLFDADGRLLTERSLLFRGRDLERAGLYLALRF